MDAQSAFRAAVKWIMEHLGRVAVPLGEVQRLVHGTTDLPLGGGPDVINGIATRNDGKRLVGRQGDSLVMFVELAPDGTVTSSSIHQYGASNRPSSKHYSDQSALFVKRELKPMWHSKSDVEQHAERTYAPGEETR